MLQNTVHFIDIHTNIRTKNNHVKECKPDPWLGISSKTERHSQGRKWDSVSGWGEL